MKVKIYFRDTPHIQEIDIPYNSDVVTTVKEYCEHLGWDVNHMSRIEIPSREHRDSWLMRETAEVLNYLIDAIVRFVIQDGMSWNQATEKVSRNSSLSQGDLWIQTVLPTVRRIINKQTHVLPEAERHVEVNMVQGPPMNFGRLQEYVKMQTTEMTNLTQNWKARVETSGIVIESESEPSDVDTESD